MEHENVASEALSSPKWEIPMIELPLHLFSMRFSSHVLAFPAASG